MKMQKNTPPPHQQITMSGGRPRRRSSRQRRATQERAAAAALFGGEFPHVPLAPNPPTDDANAADPPDPPQNNPPDVAVIPRAANAPPYINPVAANVNPAVANGANNLADVLAAVNIRPPQQQQQQQQWQQPRQHLPAAANPQGGIGLPNPPAQHLPAAANPQDAPTRGRAPRRVLSLREQYLPAMCRFASFKLARDVNEENYAQEVTPAFLRSITANDVVSFFRFRAYGDPDANDNDMPPTLLRHNTILNEKKAISFFMPAQNIPWNQVAQQGNPTRSPQVARLISNMKRFQVRRQGVSSKARRALHITEFVNLMLVFWNHPNQAIGLFAAAALAVQFALITRGDDLSKLNVHDLGAYERYPLIAILGRIVWSKNVREERDAPQQVLFGSMDTRFCVLVNLALWLEFALEHHPAPHNEFVFRLDGLDDPIRIKEQYIAAFNQATRMPGTLIQAGLVGSHSTRKLAATWGRSNGCSKASIAMFTICKICNLTDLLPLSRMKLT